MHIITRSCVLLFWMHTLTFVKSQDPLPDCTLQDFLNGPLFDSNFNTTGLEASYLPGKQIRVSCNTGSSGFFQLLCVEGQWQSRGTKCQPQQCPAIHVSVGSVVRFSCNSNSEVLIGSEEIYCDEKGQWSGEAPTCKAISCLVPVIENGRVPGDVQEYKEHDVLHFQCNPGFQPTEVRPSKCTKLGLRAEWSPTPACESNAAIPCKLELPPLHGTQYDPSKNVFSPGDTVTVTCGQRYWISDHLQTSTVVSCGMDGQWSLRPICKEVTCSNRRDPLVYWWDFYPGEQKKLGDVVGYQCITDHKSTGGAIRATCTREGWKPDPLCQVITCDRRDIVNAELVDPQDKYKIHDRVSYVCKDGYKGEVSRTCRENGWSGISRCVAVPRQ